MKKSASGQPSLFGGPEPVARRGDPETSWEAARSVRPETIRKTAAEVLAVLRDCGPCTDEEIAAVCRRRGSKQSPSGLRTRRSELVTLGLVVDSGRRALTSAGRRTIIWSLVGDDVRGPDLG